MKNLQIPEKRKFSNDGLLDVHSIFYTIQGEGPFCGTPAIFIRLAGCNLQCPGCDTDYTRERRKMSVPDIILELREKGPSKFIPLIVITGGEPFRQNLEELLVKLINLNYYVQIETNGTLPPSSNLYFNRNINQRFGVYMVCSPKTERINQKIFLNCCALKYVICYGEVDLDDGLPISALGHPVRNYVARPLNDYHKLIYVQPEDSQNEEGNKKNLEEAIRSAKTYGYILQLQLHKIIGAQ